MVPVVPGPGRRFLWSPDQREPEEPSPWSLILAAEVLSMNLVSKIFKVKIDEISGTINEILDLRYEDPVDITDGKGDFASTSFTLMSDDITTGKKPRYTPYVSRKSVYGKPCKGDGNSVVSVNEETGTKIEYILDDYCLKIKLEEGKTRSSEFGMNLPFNLMGKKDGHWTHQFLISSPYITYDNRFRFIYLTRPDRNNLLVIVENDIDGYKIDYSENNCGQFFKNIKLLSSFDRAYGMPDRPVRAVTARLVPVFGYLDALRYASSLYEVPAAFYKQSASFTGQQLKVDVIGACTHFKIIKPDGCVYELPVGNSGIGSAAGCPSGASAGSPAAYSDRCPSIKSVSSSACWSTGSVNPSSVEVALDQYGKYHVIPFNGDIKGLDCSIFAIDSWSSMSTKALMSQKQHYKRIVAFNDNQQPLWEPFGTNYPGMFEVSDKNLCESQMWALAALKQMNLFGYNGKASIDVKNLLAWMTANDPKLYTFRLTIVAEKQYGGPSYFTYNSTRIQEVFNGVAMLIEAFKLYKDRAYLEFAINAMNSVLGYCLMPDGEIRRFHEFNDKDFYTDYTTVTCMVMPIVDLANVLRGMNDVRYRVFEDAALKIAEHLYIRGLRFPTEGAENAMEDGSISCTALSLLYVDRYIRHNEKFVEFAGEVLSYHDAWSIYTHNVHMFRSSLRWWESIWEGDHDGPAINCGHSWSIWRAEAQFHYAIVTGDAHRLIDSFNGFMCSFSKVMPDGTMYSHYQCDAITGGGDLDRGEDINFRIAYGFPQLEDNSLSRYVFARACDTWFKCTAIIRTEDFDGVLNGCLRQLNGKTVLESFAPDFEILFIKGFRGELAINTEKTICIRCDTTPEVITGESLCSGEMHNITPASGKIEIRF